MVKTSQVTIAHVLVCNIHTMGLALRVSISEASKTFLFVPFCFKLLPGEGIQILVSIFDESQKNG
jgi:hypothetical protein